MLNYYLFERLGMLTNTTIILNGHFHDLLGLPVPPWTFLEIAVVVFSYVECPFHSPADSVKTMKTNERLSRS